MEDRRDLIFERLDEVMPEVERLLHGHRTTKGWTLGQILHHLATTIRLTLATSRVGANSDPDPDMTRTFAVRRRKFFSRTRFPEGAEVPSAKQIPPADADERVEAEALRVELDRLMNAEGPEIVHPMLGPLTRPEWLIFHRMHCAHHLGFAKKNQSP